MIANDNNQNWKHLRYLHNNWDRYERIEMTCFGPIGILNGEFEYLDPKKAEERA